MARMTGGEQRSLTACCATALTTVFGLPGVQTYGLFDAFARASNSLRLINARHEQTTAYMALENYACATGRPSAYAVVPGPGRAEHRRPRWPPPGVSTPPVLCLTGQVPSMMIGRGRGQLHELPDQLATLRSLHQMGGTHRAPEPGTSHLTAARLPGDAVRPPRPRRAGNALGQPVHRLRRDHPAQEPLPLHPKPQPDPERIAALGEAAERGQGSRCPCNGSEAAPSTPQRKSAPWPRTSTPPSSHFAAAEASSTTAARSA